MPNLIVGGFGIGGGNTPIYGWGAIPNPFVTPNKGLIAGGDPFTLVGVSVSTLALADSFTGGGLDGAKWTNVSSGGGSVATGVGGLKLDLTTAGGVSAIRSVQAYKNLDVGVTYSYNSAIEATSPAFTINYVRLAARIDANNQFIISHIWDHTILSAAITVTIITGGVSTTLFKIPIKGSASTLGLVRYGGRMQAYVGADLVCDYRGWRNNDVNIEITSSSPGQAIALRTTVTAYTPTVLVTFGDDICQFVAQSEDRIIGVTPAVALPGSVELRAHDASSTATLGPNSFTYFTPLQLTVSRNNNTIEINNDNTLRDTSTNEKGFRL